MPATGRGKVKNPNDKRLKANRPAPKTPPKPKTRHQMLIDGDITVDDLDDEELRKGRCRNRNGDFGGRPPSVLPAALVTTMQVELRRRINTKFAELADEALEALHDVFRNKNNAAVARVSAANSVLERVVGKVPDKVMQEVVVHKFEEDMADILVDIEIDQENNVVEFKKPKAKGA